MADWKSVSGVLHEAIAKWRHEQPASDGESQQNARCDEQVTTETRVAGTKGQARRGNVVHTPDSASLVSVLRASNLSVREIVLSYVVSP